MMYVLLDERSHVSSYQNVESVDEWEYPEGFTLIEVEDFEFDLSYDLSDYYYENGTFLLDEAGIAEREANEPYDPVKAFVAMFIAKPEIMEEMPDSDLAHMAPYMQTWEVGAEYAVGDMREYNDKPYRCLQSHTSQETWNPEDAPSLWARILSGQDGEIGVWEQPDSTNPYMKGDRVHYPTVLDPVYESDIDNNVWPPDQYGWHQLLEGE